MRLFVILFALMMSSNLAHAGRLTCWYDSEGVSTGADSGNVADADDAWDLVDVSHWGNEYQTSALFMYWSDSQGTMDGSDCPEFVPDVDEFGHMPMDQRPRPHRDD